MTVENSGSSRLISSAEVARLAGVTRAAVSNWRRRHPDFPEPVEGGRNALFALTEITDWLDRQKKSSDVSDEVLVWQDMRALYGDDMITGVADMAEMLLGGSSGRLSEETRLRAEGMAAQASASEVIEAFTERLHAGGSALTTSRLAAAIAHLAGPVTGTVFDPACGAGSLLFACAGGPDIRAVGQEISESAARLARARGALCGIEPDIKLGDSLQADGWPGLQADLVVCDPPVGLTDWGRDGLMVDTRWEFGLPTKAESELAWLQHCYSHLAPKGKLLIVMSPSVAYRRAGRRIRTELLRRGVLEQVVALPAGLVSSHTQPMHVWILRRPLESERSAPVVRMVDMSGADPQRLSAFEAVRAVEVPVIDLLDEDVDLTPASHLLNRSEQAEQYAEARDALMRRVGRLAGMLPDLSAGSAEIEGALLRVSDLARAGLVLVNDNTATSASDQIDTDFLQGFLSSAANASRNTSSSGTYRVDVRGSRIPQMGIAEQRSYGAAFRALDEAEATLKEINRLGLDAISRAREGLTSGTLRPDGER
ncbi:putative restriction-modification system adenine methylase [Actinoplanes missouriensis 431]|uniref:Putative restriction-modification system adenine methylase n=1 Tax=Actinoplanes missouriensis (strain ATCC 14538 / DSM 43046 / CBS 188.64 / JCM 3121 / NBRC 102363 / NCIMB 12654 / NRRL B-3342 / UNCC 431) TaxID=512565 RepID=I0HE10_ACTM4|nr:N-6 DNA methylase [Actinoplanes missouriensis]BAL91247.1 putative restriction-modification system adenine methylase [Actinoplanes missouriensis 431]